jgi:hypothetical protein
MSGWLKHILQILRVVIEYLLTTFDCGDGDVMDSAPKKGPDGPGIG